MATTTDGTTSLQRRVSVGKDVLSLLRDTTLVLLFLLLLVAPSFVGERLNQAGFEEGSVLGFKWKKKAETFGNSTRELEQSLLDAKRQLNEQANVLTLNQRVIADLTRRLGTEPANVTAVTEKNREALARTAAVSAATTRTLRRNEDAVDQARALAGDAKWAVVMGGDQKLAEARYEVAQARRSGIADATLYLRQGWDRTVVPAASNSEAEQFRSLGRDRHPDAYIVDLTKWCPQANREGEITKCE
jgi:hypothetical protein